MGRYDTSQAHPLNPVAFERVGEHEHCIVTSDDGMAVVRCNDCGSECWREIMAEEDCITRSFSDRRTEHMLVKLSEIDSKVRLNEGFERMLRRL